MQEQIHSDKDQWEENPTYGYNAQASQPYQRSYDDNGKITPTKNKGVSRRVFITGTIITALTSAGVVEVLNRLSSNPAAPAIRHSPVVPNVAVNANQAPRLSAAEVATQRAAIVEGKANDITRQMLAEADADATANGVTNVTRVVSDNGATMSYATTRTAIRPTANSDVIRIQTVEAIYDTDQAGIFQYGSTSYLSAKDTMHTPNGDYTESEIILQRYQAVDQTHPGGWTLISDGENMGGRQMRDTAYDYESPSQLQDTLNQIGAKYIDPALA